jgi:uncharacterized protein YjbI with pentapeptide repeats
MTSFRNANLESCTFFRADLFSSWGPTSFDNANLNQADFTAACLFNVDFRGTSLQKVRFHQATFGGCLQFQNADLRGADFSTIVIPCNYDRYPMKFIRELVNLQGVITDNETRWPDWFQWSESLRA